MISELEFTRDYTSFWRTISPLSEDFVRKINFFVLDRYETELDSNTSPQRRAFINEVGFEIFFQCRMKNLKLEIVIEEELDAILKKISAYIARQRNGAPFYTWEMDAIEVDEAREIAERLLYFFRDFKNVTIRPRFSGCGKLSSCQGDVVADNILYEVKSGGGEFRFKSIDLRQLVLYLTLNQYSKQYNISRLGLYNPRKGFHFVATHQEFSLHFSGLSTEELCHRIYYELTAADSNQFSFST